MSIPQQERAAEAPQEHEITSAVQALRGELQLHAQAFHEHATKMEELAARLWAIFGS